MGQGCWLPLTVETKALGSGSGCRLVLQRTLGAAWGSWASNWAHPLPAPALSSWAGGLTQAGLCAQVDGPLSKAGACCSLKPLPRCPLGSPARPGRHTHWHLFSLAPASPWFSAMCPERLAVLGSFTLEQVCTASHTEWLCEGRWLFSEYCLEGGLPDNRARGTQKTL